MGWGISERQLLGYFLVGLLTDAWGWDAAFYLWIAGAIVAGVLMLLLWNYKPEKGEFE